MCNMSEMKRLQEEFRQGLETLSPEISAWADALELEDALVHAPCRGGADCACTGPYEHYVTRGL